MLHGRLGLGLAVIVLGVAAAVCVAPALGASPTITEYAATPPSFSFPINPLQITVGGDGNIWYTDGGSDVYRMASSGASIGQTTGFEATQGGSPDGIVLGPDGNIWFTEGQSGEIGRVNYVGGCCSITEFELPSQASQPDPDGIIRGPDGALWFTEPGINEIGRLNPSQVAAGTSQGITEYPVPGATIGQTGGGNVAEAADSITTGPDGDLWFTEAGSQKIGVMSTSGAMVNTFPISGTLTGEPYGIVEGPDGVMWFTEAGSANRIGQVIPAGTTVTVAGNTITYGSTSVTEFSLPPAPTGAYGALWSIAVGPDHNLWFTYGAGSDNAGVGCINIEGYAAQYPAPTPGANPDGISVGADGALWFTESNPSKIARLYPVVCNATTNAQIQTLLESEVGSSAKATIPTLLRPAGYRLPVHGLTTGRLEITWYAAASAAKLARAKAKPVLVARGSISFPTAGSKKLVLKPTAKGRRLLKHDKSLKLTADGAFTPTAPHPTIQATKAIKLR